MTVDGREVCQLRFAALRLTLVLRVTWFRMAFPVARVT